MSTYEKIGLAALIGLLALILGVFLNHEYKEPRELGIRGSDFDLSLGNSFVMGPFQNVVDEQSSGGQEEGCPQLQPVIAAALRDIVERLEHDEATSAFIKGNDTFAINARTLQFLCQESVRITLSDGHGNQLVLQKNPFRRIPHGGVAENVGTDVHIDATLVQKGTTVKPTTFGDILIPDRYLDATSSWF